MVRRAVDVDFAVTDTETQALLLEANFIKRHQPPYNVRLKDDKSYPPRATHRAPRPRIEVTRDPGEGATVYGPFTNKGRVDTVIKALRETYGLRGCSDHKYSNRDRPCLDYEMDICTAPCTGEISEADYLADVESVRRFFEGETGVLADPLRRAMDEAAQATEFERAANMRDRLAAVEALGGDSDAAVSSDTVDERSVDVLPRAVREGERATVARLHRRTVGRSSASATASTRPGGRRRRRGAGRLHPAVLRRTEFARRHPLLGTPCRRGHRRLAGRRERRFAGSGRRPGGDARGPRAEERTTGGPARDDTAALAEALGLDAADRIEGFDVSHAQGTAAVGSNVAFPRREPGEGPLPAQEAHRRKRRLRQHARARPLARRTRRRGPRRPPRPRPAPHRRGARDSSAPPRTRSPSSAGTSRSSRWRRKKSWWSRRTEPTTGTTTRPSSTCSSASATSLTASPSSITRPSGTPSTPCSTRCLE